MFGYNLSLEAAQRPDLKLEVNIDLLRLSSYLAAQLESGNRTAGVLDLARLHPEGQTEASWKTYRFSIHNTVRRGGGGLAIVTRWRGT